MHINRERLALVFSTMCAIDTPSCEEGRLSGFLKDIFAREFPQALVAEDDSASATGSDANNLVIHFPGDLPGEPIFFNCHMDTVEPARGVEVVRDGTRFSSAGETILGGDDKAGIAILIEAIRAITEAGLSHLPFDLVFTTCEEIGLRGAKSLDISLLRAREGYALDSTGVDLLIIGAPAANHFRFTVTGAAAHAGLHPERGINAIQLAAKCIADLPLGRLDEESTANIGRITGGKATNIIPESVFVEGEVRSHSPEKLATFSKQIKDMVQATIDNWSPALAPSLELTSGPRSIFTSARNTPPCILTAMPLSCSGLTTPPPASSGKSITNGQEAAAMPMFLTGKGCKPPLSASAWTMCTAPKNPLTCATWNAPPNWSQHY